MSMYASMTFKEYQFQEYPKFIKTGEGVDPATKSKIAIGVTVHSAAEEAELTGAAKDSEPAPKAAAPVAAQADTAPRPRGRPPGSGKNDVLSTATVDTDQDPDA